MTVELDRETAEVLEEAAASLRDDIASGRQWGIDESSARENAEDLENAYQEIRSELREADE